MRFVFLILFFFPNIHAEPSLSPEEVVRGFIAELKNKGSNFSSRWIDQKTILSSSKSLPIQEVITLLKSVDMEKIQFTFKLEGSRGTMPVKMIQPVRLEFELLQVDEKHGVLWKIVSVHRW